MQEHCIGKHVLYLGDCLDVIDSIGPVNSVVTDPPYGVSLKKTTTKHKRVNAEYASTDDSEESIVELVGKAIAKCKAIADCIAVSTGNRLVQKYPLADDIGAVFFPNGSGVGRWGFICSHPILYYGKCPYLAKGMGSRPSGVSATHWNRRKDAEHPCEKPLQMMEWMVRRASLEGYTVLDPFMGSGTTGVACVNTGRRFIGIEKEQKYFDIACKRIEQAVLLAEQVAPV